MSGWRLSAVIVAVAAGVLLPKAAPAALMGRRVGPRVERVLAMLPAALLGGLAVVSLLGSGPGWRPGLPVAVAMVVAAAVMAVTRRTLLSMIGGWAALAAALFLAG
jgi:branched-subunit amino acid transport protein